MKFGVVGNLLSDLSLETTRNNRLEITLIPRSEIRKNTRNGYEISNVEELAADIKESGLAQPLEVLALEDGYRLLTGERRLTAIDRLIASGDWDMDIPCVVKELEDYDLPLSDDAKEMYAIIRTNRFTRNKSDADLMFESAEWTKIVQELKAAGRSELQITPEDGAEQEINLQGRTREIVAKTMNLSNGQVAKMDYIRSHGSAELMQGIEQGLVNIATGYQIAGWEQEEQHAFFEQYKGKLVDAKKIKEYLNDKKIKEETFGKQPGKLLKEELTDPKEKVMQWLLEAMQTLTMAGSAGCGQEYMEKQKYIVKVLRQLKEDLDGGIYGNR